MGRYNDDWRGANIRKRIIPLPNAPITGHTMAVHFTGSWLRAFGVHYEKISSTWVGTRTQKTIVVIVKGIGPYANVEDVEELAHKYGFNIRFHRNEPEVE